ncbi:aminotransferase [Pseudogracilibacillus auburnensis]|uniref:Aminotransferase n=1 Tax=Pseudogracilibacillus auburnensis TaxID=1494959 RepID=A0A2V3W4R8_9BACI|nr:pyridoxal phosphate-dependent aminotransferase [Pseudogracilibacillus auburnensis]PXW88041.1 aminotransferase [Pseudogracilibacillus auburnensis]
MQIFEQSDAIKRLPEQFFAKLGKRVRELIQEGHDVINLGQGNPDLPTADHIVKALQEAAEKPINHKYSPFQGFPYFKQAVADFYKREYDVDLNPDEEVALMFGSKIGLFEVSQCLLNPGDTALLPNPGYPDYLSGVALANVTHEFMPLLEENGFLPDYSKISEDVLQKAKLMFLNYPNNPTSGVATKAFFDDTVALAKKHDICVVHDFAYGAIGFDGVKQPSFLASEGAKDVGIEMYTLSKTYNMAGWRVAFAVGNPSVIKTINLLQDHLFTSLFGAIQEAATEAISGDLTYVRELVDIYEKRRNVLVDSLRKIGWEVEAPKGTFFAWFPVPNGYTSAEFAKLLLEEAHVVVASGDGFGTLGEGYVRLGLLDSEERLREAAERIGKLGLFR